MEERTIMHLRIYFFFVQFAIFCNLYHDANAMVGINVRDAKKNEYPFVVSIMRVTIQDNRKTYKHFCTGALISIKDVLTADHCMNEEKVGLVRVMIGSINLKRGRKYHVAWWGSYSNWAKYNKIQSNFKNNDITIIRLARDVLEVTPALLSTTSTYGFYGLNVVAVGWGKTNDQETPRIMKVADLKVITNTDCEARVEKIQGEKYSCPLRYLCTVAEPFALLDCGDSGGPLIHDGVIIGISTSTCPLPEQKIHPDKVNLHLVIDYYTSFINDVKYKS